MAIVKRRRPRQYQSSVAQFFHNYEHDPKGLNHCHSDGQYPYRVFHYGGKHVITGRVACGHGKGGMPQWFMFSRKLGGGWDLSSGQKISHP